MLGFPALQKESDCDKSKHGGGLCGGCNLYMCSWQEKENFSLCPVPAASIRYLRGAELAVMQVSSNQQICAQFEFQNKLPLQVRPDGGRVSAKDLKPLTLVQGFGSAFPIL